MNYTEAVHLALAGDEKGFEYLYENTYKSKYYLALQYMKNNEAAEDVLQDAYLKAFSKLDTIENPENFPAWFGQIVANTAKNMLVKKKPILFTEVEAETEVEDFELYIEDDDMTKQPELAYTQEETRALVRELIDALSDEQRMCVLMFHIEEYSIKEIAEVLGCSENTVKSRLNYGRKNIKAKAEELQKKGYKLYGVAPLPLLLLLLRKEKTQMIADGSIENIGKHIAKNLFKKMSKAGNVNNSVKNTVKTTKAKTAFLHTTAGKLVSIVAGIGVAGAVIYGATQAQPNNEIPVSSETVQQTEVVPETETVQETETETETEVKPIEVSDADYENLLEGALTKDQLQFALAYGPDTFSEDEISSYDWQFALNSWCQAGHDTYITYMGSDAQYRSGYLLEDINRYISVFSDFRYSEATEGYGLVDVDGDVLWYVFATLNYEADITIEDAAYCEDLMVIHYLYEKTSYEYGLTTTEKTATLKKNDRGKFMIVRIEDGNIPAVWPTEVEEAAKNQTTQQEVAAESTDTLHTIYENVLHSIQNQEAGYEFPNGYGSTEFKYFIHDMNGDGISELIVADVYPNNRQMLSNIRVFSAVKVGAGYQLQMLDGDVTAWETYIPSDGNGLYLLHMTLGTGVTDIYRATISGNSLISSGSPELTYIMNDEVGQQFLNSNQHVQWLDISDASGINELN